MKAAVVRKANDFLIEDRPIPEPKAGQVLIRVHACGVCHSDLEVLLGHFPFATYRRSGHEVAGTVEKVGSGVTWPKVGDRVGMPWLYDSCGHCDYCVSGREVLCPQMTVTGVNRDGGYQEYMLAPAAYVGPIPDGLDFAEAGPLMCAGLTVFNGLRQAGFQPGQKVAVVGWAASDTSACCTRRRWEVAWPSFLTQPTKKPRRVNLARTLHRDERKEHGARATSMGWRARRDSANRAQR